EVAEKTVTAMIRPQDVEVLVLEAVEPLTFAVPPQMAPGYAPEQAARMKESVDLARKNTEQTATRLRAAGFKANSRGVESDGRTAIRDTAAEWKPDLIVVGSQGRRGIAKFLLGSVADAVARHAPCSVFIVRAQVEAKAGSLAA